MSSFKDRMSGISGVITIAGSIVVVTAFSVTASLKAFSNEEKNRDQSAEIKTIESAIHALDKSMAVMAISAETQSKSFERQEAVINVQADDIREVKQLLLEMSRNK